MKQLDKLILGTFLPTLVLTFFICLFVLVLQFLFVWMDEIIGKGLDTLVIIEFFFYLFSSHITIALPLAVLLASLMTYGNLGEHYELVVIKSSGISLMKAMRGNLIAIFVICGLAFLCSNYYLPFATLKVTTILHDIREKAPTFSLKENEFYNEMKGFSIRIDKKDKDNKTVRDILIYDHRSGRGNTNVLHASKGIFENVPDYNALIFKMEDGNQYEEVFEKKRSEDKQKHFQVRFEKWEKTFDLSSFGFDRSDENLFKDNSRMLNVSQLSYTIDSIGNKSTTEAIRLSNSLSANFLFLDGSKDSLHHFDFTKTKVNRKYKNKKINQKEKKKKKKSKHQQITSSYKRTNTKKKNKAPFHLTDSIYNIAIENKSFLSQFPYKTQSALIKKGIGSLRNIKNTATFYKERERQIRRDINIHKIEWHRKFILSIACLVFFLLGAPLGAIIRKGGFGLPFILTIVLYLVFHVISMSFEKMAKQEVVSPFIGMWVPVMTFLPFGLIMMSFVTIESLSIKSIFNLFKKAK